MTVHIVCLDGTNQTKNQPNPTNIARIFDMIGTGQVDGGNNSFENTLEGANPQTGKYLAGVGTDADPVLKVLGNVFGDGIAEPIVRGYTYLSRVFQAGDALVIVGFSRGATAARALAGLIVAKGLLDSSRYQTGDKTASYLRGVAAWYAYRKPNGDFADQARLAMIGGTVGTMPPELVPADYTTPATIRAVAVFDTVSSLGLPQFGSSGAPIFDFSICDTTLNPAIAKGFHALAADETRDLFSPTFWAERDGVVQQAFPGCHSDVGGGFPHRGLSDGALQWMMTRLEGVGLVFDPTGLGAATLAPNPLDVAQNDGATFPFSFTPRSARAFPKIVTPSGSMIDRWGDDTEMLPTLAPKAYQAIGTYADGTPLYIVPS